MERRQLLTNFEVTSALDVVDPADGEFTLREAVEAANNSSELDTITFASSLLGSTIQLQNGQMTVSGELIITGPGSLNLTIDAQNNSRVFAVPETADLTIDGLTLTNGNDSGSGAIQNDGDVTIRNSVISNSSANNNFEGGGALNNTGNVTIIGSVLSGNTADNSFGGGGAIQNFATGTVTILGSTIANNSATSSFLGGGAILNFGTLLIEDSTLNNNSAIGRNDADATFGGGGIQNTGNGQVTISNSTLFGNFSDIGGGAIHNPETGNIRLTNTTVTGNEADGVQGGGGIWSTAEGFVTLHNAIVAGNLAGEQNDIFGPVDQSSAHNIIGEAGTSGLINDDDGNLANGSNNIVGIDWTTVLASESVDGNLIPLLADSGGATQTVALLAGSPAIDAGINSLALGIDRIEPLTTDQRGPGFARIVDGDKAGAATVDIGAFEFGDVGIPGDVDGDGDFDANDSFLIHLIRLSGTDQQVDQSKGASPLNVTQIRENVSALNSLGDVDGDSDFDANDSFLIHLERLAGTNSQIDQSKGASPLTATQIRANVEGLGGTSMQSFSEAPARVSNLQAVPGSTATNLAEHERIAHDTVFADFRGWLNAI